ncbi:peptidoglycan recognition protein-like [Bicyclus anynana]|uniref:Peptidoglycan-recognition protein n=1 Tax=Bicyclus anynana TaxID=110368 RepID=A0A6J1P6S4_BICAN|nr:peptidoglycan recognition protein-like [Bicyclus anynana]
MATAQIALFLVVVTVSQFRFTVADCDAVPIEKWGGSPLNRSKELSRPVKIAVVQHTVTPECSTDAECEEAVRFIREMQIKNGFDDIAQSFVVGGNGKVYEGAGWKVGAHTFRWNEKSIGISFVGDFREKLPSPQALQAAQKFLECSVGNKNLDEKYHLVGHLQLTATISPGAELQNLIETWPHWLRDVSILN